MKSPHPAPTARHPSAQGNALGPRHRETIRGLKGRDSYDVAATHRPNHRAPLGRMGFVAAGNPARWAGLRDHGPLARNAMRFRNSAVALPEHRASLAELDALFASLQHRAFRGEL